MPDKEHTVSVSRYQRAIERNEKRRRSESCYTLFSPSEVTIAQAVAVTSESVSHQTVSCQTELLSCDVVSKEEFDNLKEELDKIKKEHHELLMKSTEREVTQVPSQYRPFDEDYFKDSDDKVRFFTGLTNWDILSKLFQFVLPHFVTHSSLSKFQQLSLTLMRLRLGSTGVELGYHFGIHPSTVCRIFSDVVGMLYVRTKFLIVWPEREILRKTLPMDFRKNCPNCVVILDCFEVFIDRPSDLLARAQTYSSYKHHNTVKYLIGISPQGSVSFISDGWGGRVSDKHITENFNLLHNLLPGDTILADRGFDIKDSIGLYSATLSIPAFTKGKKQLEAIDVEQTRTIANVRIHVERVIGNIRKKYKILGNSQPVDYLNTKDDTTLLDMIVTVCCSLINLCNSVVPFD